MGRPALTRSQHVDHVNDDELANLRVLGAEFHGRLHACVYEECKQVAGDWRELDSVRAELARIVEEFRSGGDSIRLAAKL